MSTETILPNMFSGATTWAGVCELSRVLAPDLGEKCEQFADHPKLKTFRTYPGLNLDLVYTPAFDFLVKVTGSHIHVAKSRSFKEYRGWGEQHSQEFRWESRSLPLNGASVTAKKHVNRCWTITIIGASTGLRESSLFISFLSIHFLRSHFQLNRPELLNALLAKFD